MLKGNAHCASKLTGNGWHAANLQNHSRQKNWNKTGFIADEKGFTLNFAVQEDGLVRNGKLLTDEEIAAIPAQFKALFSEIGR